MESISYSVIDKIRSYCISMKPIVIMYDFFLDRIIKVGSPNSFISSFLEKSKFGGGSMRGFSSYDIMGGNAVNVAYCLASLGAKIILFTMADEIGKSILKNSFSKFDENDVKLCIVEGKHGLTTSFELLSDDIISSKNVFTKSNIMISDVRENANLGPKDLFKSKNDLEILNNSAAIMILNWATNFKGSDLVKTTITNSPNSFHFLDPADIESRKDEFILLLKEISNKLDILSINENECNTLLKKLRCNSDLFLTNNYNKDTVKKSTKLLSSRLNIAIDLHTRIGSCWSDGKDTIFSHSVENILPKRLTGAGDSWDAADILGHLVNLPHSTRLKFANLYSSYYISKEDRDPATLEEIKEFGITNNVIS